MELVFIKMEHAIKIYFLGKIVIKNVMKIAHFVQHVIEKENALNVLIKLVSAITVRKFVLTALEMNVKLTEIVAIKIGVVKILIFMDLIVLHLVMLQIFIVIYAQEMELVKNVILQIFGGLIVIVLVSFVQIKNAILTEHVLIQQVIALVTQLMEMIVIRHVQI
jgi:hypothetical protein